MAVATAAPTAAVANLEGDVPDTLCGWCSKVGEVLVGLEVRPSSSFPLPSVDVTMGEGIFG